MPMITLANGRQFSADDRMSVLNAADAAAVVLEHSCRTGRCGSCKARVLSGEVQPLIDAPGLSAAQREAGWVLTCADSAVSDLHLDIEDLSALAGITARTLPARIQSLERLAPDVLQVVLRLPPNAGFRFLPGQYVDVTSPSGIKRSYSLASDAQAPDRLTLQVRQVEQGEFSAYWFEQAQLNDLLRFHGPRGTFFLRPVAGLDLVFLATGTGIAPIQSLLMQVARLPADEQPASVSLFWGGRVAADLYWTPVPGEAGMPVALRPVPVLSRCR